MAQHRSHVDRSLVLITLILFVLAPVAFGAEPPKDAPPVIREVKFVYLDPLTGAESPVTSPSPEWFAGKARLAVGLPYSQKTAEEELTRFPAELGMLLREVRPEPVKDGLRVTYILEKRPLAFAVRVVPRKGAPSVPATTLMEKAVKLREGMAVSVAAVSADRWAIVEYLRRDGYAFAAADARYEPTPSRAGHVDVTFEVDRGPKVIVEEISFTGNRAFSRKQLLAMMATREDTWLTSRRFVRTRLDADLENIKRRYLAAGYEDVKVDVLPALFDPEHVRITVNCRDEGGKNIVRSVSVSGAQSISRSEIRRHFLSPPGREYSPEQFDKDIDWLRGRYYEAGFRADPADVRIDTEPKDGRTAVTAQLVFGKALETVTIDVAVKPANGGIVVQKADLTATGPFPGQQLADLLQDMRPGQPFSEDGLLRDTAAVSAFYAQAGPGYALIDSRYERTADGYRAMLEFQKKGSTARPRIRIGEGTMYVVENVSFQGVDPDLEEHIRDRLRMKQGTLFTREALAADVQTVAFVYQEQGHADVKVREDVQLAQPGQKVYSVKYVVEPGPKYHIDLIRPRGNDKTKPVVITREMAIKPGDRYDVREIQESVRRLRNLRYFDEVEITPVDSNRKGPDDTRYKDLVVRVKEANTRRLFIGGGASSAIGVFGDFRYEDANFDLANWPASWGDFVSGSALSGGGQTLSVFLQPGSNASQFGIDWREPWLNGRPVELDVSVGYFTRDWDDYTVSKLGGSVTLGKRFQPTLTGFVGLRAHRVTVSGVSNTAPSELRTDEGPHNILGLSAGVTRNTLDDRVFPTTGKKYTLMGELIGDPFFNALKLTAEGRWYKPVYEAPDGSKHVLSWWGDVGTIAGGDVPVFERFYAGGLGSVRGFATHGISPLAVSPLGQSAAVGGRFKMEGGVEYHFPIIKDSLRGLVFLDAGSVSEDTLGIGNAFSDLRVSTGVGVHFLIPQLGRVPIVMYLGFPLKKVSGDDTEAFSFSLGILFP